MAFCIRALPSARAFRFSEVRVRAATLLGTRNYDTPKRSSVPLPFAVLRCDRPGATDLWSPRHLLPQAYAFAYAGRPGLEPRLTRCLPLAFRSRRRGIAFRRTQACQTPRAGDEEAETDRKAAVIRKELRALRPVSAGTLRVPVVRYLGFATRASGIQHSVYGVLADHILPVTAD